jgi:hypothetical protein
MAKMAKGNKPERTGHQTVFCRILMDAPNHTADSFQKKLILQLQNKLTEFTVLHYNCDHSSM